MAKGKKSFEVDKKKLQEALNKAEVPGPFKNLHELWVAAEKIYNKMDVPRAITFSVVALRAKDWKLTYKTVKGKQGRGSMSPEQKAKMQAARVSNKGAGGKRSRGDKFKRVDGYDTYRDALLKQAGKRYKSLAEGTLKGSLSSARKLNCVQCMGFSSGASGMIRNCTASGANGSSPCSWWLSRPYQGELEPEELDENAEVVAPDEEEVIDEAA